MKLNLILKYIDYDILQGNLNTNVDDIFYDSSDVTESSLFLALKGNKNDGHNFIEDAYKKGARVFIVDESIAEYPKNSTVIKVASTREIAPIIASNYYNAPSSSFKLIGITGTNGKTSITSMLEHILTYMNINNGSVGTLGSKINKQNIKEKKTTPTTPEAFDLQKVFSVMRSNSAVVAVIEASSMALVQHRVDSCNFDLAIFTNLTQDHLDDHGNMENYKNAKLKLFGMSKCSIVNNDDIIAKEVIDTSKNVNSKIFTYSINNESDFRAKDLELNSTGVKYKIFYNNHEKNVVVPIPCKFTVYNSLAALVSCITLGYNIDEVIEALSTINSISGRFQTINSKKGYSVIVDYAHTPDALENVIKSTKEFTTGKTILVFGCGGNRDSSKRKIMGEIAGKYADYTYITSDNPRFEEPKSICDQIESGFKEVSISYEVEIDRKKAIEKAIKSANLNDSIIIAGKGNETYQLIRDIKHHFSDVEIVESFIND
ncbi:UDP-N-acetylmuramoyl-L-alanyl-D-glutamate--2,6-diaminopimelate ligase [Clostridium estertheticum]|uniref:UDP-N-acetylmuramoyl-L-alanyl-D-glutamate--2, 6-diaminopimelate ligase n=1 Tax=Clostridium estertheticum TaxID=238834 RepID=UPI001C0C2362|nr:UDP-N-acetylmuramoyl-L-alanyl-D-glutamate--2,6-diaminopimelate ligase [Clostridium estertheticum]MBU3179271.1 UDP-N-acetylmuramoyl-L-alanyl-D-glutamate--2,6-diaminopimelate ligase [Clostridium estertheticum]